MNRKGFTLIELMIVIMILGILASLITGNLISSIKKGRDARRKEDLHSIQVALEDFYTDQKAYPNFDFLHNGNSTEFCQTSNCNPNEKRYMVKIPVDPLSSATYNYVQASDLQSYKIYSTIENSQDQGPGVNQNGYSGYQCGVSSNYPCKYGLSSTNTNP